MSVRSFLRQIPRLQIRLSTMLVMVLTAGVLMGMNFHPFNFYYPRPGWIEDLKMYMPQPEDVGQSPPQWQSTNVYGWPIPAFPTWNWSGNGDIGTEFPSWKHYTSEAAELHVACTITRWNYKALGFNIAFCLGTVAFAGAGWQLAARRIFSS